VDTVRTSLLGDLTINEGRGKSIGRFNAVVSLSSAIGFSLGGFMAKIYGLRSLFYLASPVITLSTLLLFLIREKEFQF